MIMIRLSAVGALEIPSPHPVNQFEPNVGQSENNNTRDGGSDCGVNIHYEDEIMNVNQFRKPRLRRERCVDTRVDSIWRSYAIMRNWEYKPTSE
jgi:hypothetical protein